MDVSILMKRNLKVVVRLVTVAVLLASLSINTTGQQRIEQFMPAQVDQRVLEQQRIQKFEQQRVQQQLEQQRLQKIELHRGLIDSMPEYPPVPEPSENLGQQPRPSRPHSGCTRQ